ncbi:hypothetical protein O0I10_007877 [Lichtheimia ornata]|uniref:CBS domain-containing protein n=1 Tax=Lichtheimia ornata TaxID=688661 RepID=A0AAD7XTL3_9FUNG|nr:uncharacterized protein O0I10_007877 [Lichtheimia ornata]KAJ8656554.1 hypothetical protein O0I10_007877 [Lichtheimia ornata]
MNTSSSPPPPSNEDHESLLLESPSPPPAATTATDLEEPCEIQTHMRSFLKQHTAYDVLPVSYRLIVFDTRLLVKKALGALVQNGIVSAPLWSSDTHQFAGMLTVSDFVHLIQYYYHHMSVEDALQDIEKFEIGHLRDLEKKLDMPAPQLVSMHPMATLYDACQLLATSRAHRVPLLDHDHLGTETIISVVTQYRILKFIAVNFKHTQSLRRTLADLKIGTYKNIATATMTTPVVDLINTFVDKKISAVPIVDDQNVVLNVYETVDVMSIARAGRFNDLDMPVEEALEARPKNYPGVHTCTLNDTLYSVFRTIRKQRVYRLIVIDQDQKLVGIVSLSDILGYLVGYEH